MRYYITTKQNTPLIHHIICAENIGMDPVVPCLFDDFFAAFLTKSGKGLKIIEESLVDYKNGAISDEALLFAKGWS